jgi:hypothetical protein
VLLSPSLTLRALRRRWHVTYNCSHQPETNLSSDTQRESIMLKARVWAVAAVVVIALVGLVILAPAGSMAADKDVVAKNHWRHHGGHWSYWYEPDRRWYYTDGTHWFYTDADGDAWRLYRFDRKFGREDFERGDYRMPDERAKIVVPRHKVWHRR